MRAVGFSQFGGPEVLEVVDLPDPVPGPGEAVGAIGGDAIQIGKAGGLRVIADAAPKDEELIRSLGADVVVPRGPEVAAAILAEVPGGVDGAIDAALIGSALLPAARDGGGLAAVRTFDGEMERGITIHRVASPSTGLRSAITPGITPPSTASAGWSRTVGSSSGWRTPCPSQAGEAQAKLAPGGVRGHLIIVF